MGKPDGLKFCLETVDDLVGLPVGDQAQADRHTIDPRKPIVMIHTILGAPATNHSGGRVQKRRQISRANAFGIMVILAGLVHAARKAFQVGSAAKRPIAEGVAISTFVLLGIGVIPTSRAGGLDRLQQAILFINRLFHHGSQPLDGGQPALQ